MSPQSMIMLATTSLPLASSLYREVLASGLSPSKLPMQMRHSWSIVVVVVVGGTGFYGSELKKETCFQTNESRL